MRQATLCTTTAGDEAHRSSPRTISSPHRRDTAPANTFRAAQEDEAGRTFAVAEHGRQLRYRAHVGDDQKPTRRQHVVPRWYLERFADQNHVLGVHDRVAQRRYKASTAKVGVVNNFYDVDHPELDVDAVEKLLSMIEYDAAHAVRRLAQLGADALTSQERSAIATFMSAQQLRGLDTRAVGDQITDGLAKAGLIGMSDSDLRAAMEADLGRSPTDDELATHRALLDNIDGYSVRLPGSHVRFMLEHLEGLARVFMFGYRWYVAYAESRSIFTSDAPIGLWADGRPVGAMTAEEILVPLDPSHVLVLQSREFSDIDSDPEALRAGPTVDANADLIGRVLNTVGLRSERWILMHPRHRLYERGAIPPPPEPLGGVQDLIEMVRLMREGSPKPTVSP